MRDAMRTALHLDRLTRLVETSRPNRRSLDYKSAFGNIGAWATGINWSLLFLVRHTNRDAQCCPHLLEGRLKCSPSSFNSHCWLPYLTRIAEDEPYCIDGYTKSPNILSNERIRQRRSTAIGLSTCFAARNSNPCGPRNISISYNGNKVCSKQRACEHLFVCVLSFPPKRIAASQLLGYERYRSG